MNLFHRWYCNSKGWAKAMHEGMLPGILGGVDLGDHVLEIGPGPGVVTEWLRTRVPRVTSIEIDGKLAAALRQRFEGTNVTVVEGDATRMELTDSSFSSAVCFTMLHHVPSPQAQDRLLAEAHRVLRSGAMLIGADSTPSLTWNIYHLFDTRTPVDPDAFAPRLERAGFTGVTVRRAPEGRPGFSFRGTKAA